MNGKEYTYYQANQQQRKMERDIRATKREIEAQKAIGGSTTELQNKLRGQTAAYKKFSADAGLKVKQNRLRVVGGSSNFERTKTYRKYRNSITDNKKNGIISIREKLASGKYPTSNEVIDDIIQNELKGVQMSVHPAYNGRVRTPGKTICELYPWGEPKKIKSIELGKQVNDTRESVIDTLLHEELEARIMMRAKQNGFYEKLNSASEEDRHKYINKVIKRFFKGKGLNYDMV